MNNKKNKMENNVQVQDIMTKYKPKRLEDYHQHAREKKRIQSWFEKGFRGKKRNLFIFGKPNVGKTTLLSLFIKRFGWDAFIVSSSEIFSSHAKTIRAKLSNLSNNNSVKQYFSVKKRHACFIVEDFDHSHVGTVNLLKYILKMEKCVPCIFVAQDTSIFHSVSSLRQRTLIVELPLLSFIERRSFTEKISKREKLTSNIGKDKQQKIASCSRTCFDILKVFQSVQKTKTVCFEKSDSFEANKCRAVRKLIEQTKELTTEEKERIYSFDPSHISQILFENIPIFDIKEGSEIKSQDILRAMELFIQGKMSDSFVFSHQKWELALYSEFCNLGLSTLYEGRIPDGWIDMPKFNSKSCQYYYQLKSQQSIQQKFGKSKEFNFLLCDNILHSIIQSKKDLLHQMDVLGLSKKEVNALKRLSLSTISKIKF